MIKLALCIIAFPTALWIGVALIHYIAWGTRHQRTKDLPPLPGDVWIQDNDEESALYITRVTDTGRICMQTYPPNTRPFCGSSWSDSPEQWRHRVKERLLWRKRP